MNLISTLIKIVHCFHIKIVHCFLYKQFLRFCIKLFSVQYYLRNCSLSFLHKLFICSLFKKIVHYFLIKHLVKLCFLNLNAKSECFFLFKFHNNRIYFSALIKYVSTLIKFSLCTSYLLYIQFY